MFWETEPGTEIRPQAELPDPHDGVDEADTFAAFLDAARWGAIASADPRAFQSPFRAGIDIEDYQLLPLVEALRMPRVNLLIADDVGLGKTVEAGLIAQELVLRNQAQKILVVCPPSLCQKWQREMSAQFGLGFRVVDTDLRPRVAAGAGRRGQSVPIPPAAHRVDGVDQVRVADALVRRISPTIPTRIRELSTFSLSTRLIGLLRPPWATTPESPCVTKAMRRLAPHFEHRLFLTATPHNGYPESFQALLEMLDPNRFTKGVQPSERERDAVMVRRLKSHLRTMLPDGDKRFPKRTIGRDRSDVPA